MYSSWLHVLAQVIRGVLSGRASSRALLVREGLPWTTLRLEAARPTSGARCVWTGRSSSLFCRSLVWRVAGVPRSHLPCPSVTSASSHFLHRMPFTKARSTALLLHLLLLVRIPLFYLLLHIPRAPAIVWDCCDGGLLPSLTLQSRSADLVSVCTPSHCAVFDWASGGMQDHYLLQLVEAIARNRDVTHLWLTVGGNDVMNGLTKGMNMAEVCARVFRVDVREGGCPQEQMSARERQCVNASERARVCARSACICACVYMSAVCTQCLRACASDCQD
jgi:hypothetical protein